MSEPQEKGFRSRKWELTYKTSSLIDNRPVKILHDFYIPALSLAVRYDRVAGYFRSSSLAAASQGFSAFVGRRGKMRLIVGADIEPADARAILEGDSKRFERALNAELEQRQQWPEDVCNGVALLAWMIANDYLEVRVAFRLHQETGEPIPFSNSDDGYVHEKWFIMEDEFGNRMHGAGSLNESKTGLQHNAENIALACDWWGPMDKQRVEEAVQSFDALWAGRIPHLPVFTLPEAVRKRLISFAEGIKYPVEIDGTPPAVAGKKEPSNEEKLKFAVIRDAPKMPKGRFVGMETAPVAPWPHQSIVVRKLIDTWPYSYLLCDEVGLGKTIEAGLAFRSLYLSGIVRRILIAAPASLTHQWQRQMASKMLLSFGRVVTGPQKGHEYIFPVEEKRPADSLYQPNLVIMSTGLLTRDNRLRELESCKGFDIALVDEAHAARRSNPTGGSSAHPKYGKLYKAINVHLRNKSRSLWLATATPMQIDPVEACDLMGLTDRVGAFQFDPTLTMQYYEAIGKLVQKQELEPFEWDFLRRALNAIKEEDPLLWEYLDSTVVDGRIKSVVTLWLEQNRTPRRRDRDLMLRLIFGGAPLSRIMLRHNRQLLQVYREEGMLKENLARRRVYFSAIEFKPEEREVYYQLEDYCRGLAQQLARNNHENRVMISFLLSSLRLRFASSFYAFRKSLERRRNKVLATLDYLAADQSNESSEEFTSLLKEFIYESEDENEPETVAEALLKNRTKEDLEWEKQRLDRILTSMGRLQGPSSKMRALLRKLEERHDRQTGRICQTVIFTRFYDTLVEIVNRLRIVHPHILIGTYSGKGAEYYDPRNAQMVSVDREEVKRRFLRGEIDVLVCTDAAAEGLNLQTADLLINFDLGWNPMKVEQRIGRIDRIGQKHAEIEVLSLCYAGSVEEIVYGRLLDRLKEAHRVVGAQQLSLLPVEPEEFRELAEGTLSPEELEERAFKRVQKQRAQAEKMEMRPRALYEIYQRLERMNKVPVPVDLNSIWQALSESDYLQSLGCVVDQEKKTVTLYGIKGIPDGTVLTTSRKLYDEGLPDEGVELHFASYGDPVFEQLLEHLTSFELSDCIRRISRPIAGLKDVEIVGYAVSCSTSSGNEPRLITAWRDLENLQLGERSLSEAEVASFGRKLARLGRREFDRYRALNRIECANRRAALAHEILALLVGAALLEEASHDNSVRFSEAFRDVEKLTHRKTLILNGLSADILEVIDHYSFFDCQIGTAGPGNVRFPRTLLKCGADAISREADALKTARSKLTARSVLNRVNGRVKDLFSHLQREMGGGAF